MPEYNSAVGIFKSHLQAEDAVQELKRRGVDIAKLSIVGQDRRTGKPLSGTCNKDDRMMFWGKQGKFWGGLWGLLFNAEFVRVSGLGPLLVALIIAAIQGVAVAGGLSVVGTALCGMGIPKANVLQYESAIKTGKCVLIFHSTTEEVQKTGRILGRAKALGIALHVAAPAGVA